jgi:outer membrane receptor protein involved in Fe transport
MPSGIAFLAGCAVHALAAAAAAQEAAGRVEGRVVRADGTGVAGVSVVLTETSQTDISRPNGVFSFANVPPGTYSLSFVLGENVVTRSDVVVAAGATTRIEETVDWQTGFLETLTVYAASRKTERIVEAPAAVTSVSEREIAQRASSGQLPKLLEFTPGAEVTQSGVYDYNFNTRGFNSSLNRRVATLIDGRDPAVPFLGAQEWAAISFPLDDIETLELVRGPSAALYGANASSGVLNMTTKPPRYSQGGMFRITGGQLDTVNLDFRWAGSLGGDWYAKVLAGLRNTGDFTVSRNGRAEYAVPCTTGVTRDCLPQERVPLARENDDNIYFGGIRIDKYLANGMALSFEGGLAGIAGPVFQTGIGRVQVVEAQRPWARFNWNADRFNFLAYYNGRDAPRQLALSSGSNVALDEYNLQFEGQTNWRFAGDRVRVVVGASAGVEEIDSFDRDLGRQTLLFEAVESDQQALFGQVDWKIADQLKLVLAGRGDWSSLHEAQFSPKASVVYSFHDNHSLRFTYNRAFQVANYSEFFLQADVAPPANLTALNALCAPFGVNCGLGVTRVLALGNQELEVEKIRTGELGYSGVIENKAFLTIEYYRSVAEDFITDLIPQLGTALGRVNPAFGPWQAPAGLPAPVADGIRRAVPLLSNNVDGSNILAAVSYTNFGQVDTQGIDLAVNYYLNNDWTASFAYSWFDFEIQDALPGFDALLIPNSPENKFNLGLSYARSPFDARVSLRWVDDFRWGVGPFQGDIEAYTTVDLSANYALNKNWKLGLNVANLLDNEHWEAFGGDLLRRRALASLTFTW